MTPELVLGAAAAVLAVAWVATGRPRPAWAAGILLAAVACGLAFAAQRTEPDDRAANDAPATDNDAGYVGSKACRACHTGPHATWQASFHRSMTQLVSRATFKPPWRDARFDRAGASAELRVDGEALLASFDSPHWLAELRRNKIDPRIVKPEHRQRVDGPLTIATGSHHQQTYWVRSASGAYIQFPYVWLVRDGRWVANEDSFLQPPGAHPDSTNEWGANCLGCHSVAGRPKIDVQAHTAAPEVAELGIACEACHGPGGAHVAANRNAARRYAQHLRDDEGDSTIVHPGRLDHRRSTEVCGRCHSVWNEKSTADYRQNGHPYRPGDRLADTVHIIRQLPDPQPKWMKDWLARGAKPGAFWPDWTIRVAGREYQGLLETACFQRGEMSCLSCHKMHGYDSASDQLDPERAGDRMCVQCHTEHGADVAAHSHHPPGSSGARCINCHMPHTTWGLYRGIHSHRITSPRPAAEAAIGKPNACNQCHLDRTLAWAEGEVSAWAGRPPEPVSAPHERLPASVVWLIQGDAVQRGLAAWTFGWAPAIAASGKGWMAGMLLRGLIDPYAAVRYTVAKAMAAHPVIAGVETDFVRAPASQGAAVAAAFRAWSAAAEPVEAAAAVTRVVPGPGTWNAAALEALEKGRDNRAVSISE